MTKVKKLLKKAFTLVELVVVVAIIAILSGVSVAAYVGITDRANKAADQDVVAQLNLQLAAQEAIEGKNKSCYDAVADCISSGLNIEEMKPNTKNCEYVWDEINDRFGIITDKGEVLTEDSTLKLDLTKKNKIWRLSTVVPATSEYPIYLREGSGITEITGLKFGLDVGFNDTVESITYVGNDSSTENVTIRSGELKTSVYINSAKSSNVSIYGYAGIVEANVGTEGSDLGKISIYGTVGRAQLKNGHVSVENKATVYNIQDMDNTKTSYVSKTLTATIYEYTGHSIYGTLDMESDSRFDQDIFTKVDLNDDTETIHTENETVYDRHHAYKMCKDCGYSLVSAYISDEAYAEVALHGEEHGSTNYYVVPTKDGIRVQRPYEAYSFSLSTYEDTFWYLPNTTFNIANSNDPLIFTNNVMVGEQRLCSHENTKTEHLKQNGLDGNPICGHKVICQDCGYNYIELHNENCTEHVWDNVNHCCTICEELGLGSSYTDSSYPGSYSYLAGQTWKVWGSLDLTTKMCTKKHKHCNYALKYEFDESQNYETLNEKAFINCYSLVKIDLPSTIKTLSKSSFFEAIRLREVALPEGLETIPQEAFWACYSLNTLSIPNGVKNIRKSAFGFCCRLENLYLPNTLESVAKDMVYGIYNEKAIKNSKISNDLVIHYDGTMAKWKSIYRGDSQFANSTVLSQAGYSVQCTDGTLTGTNVYGSI